jgi:hypothetical protein
MNPVSFVIKEPGVTRCLGSVESATILKGGTSEARRMSTILFVLIILMYPIQTKGNNRTLENDNNSSCSAKPCCYVA